MKVVTWDHTVNMTELGLNPCSAGHVFFQVHSTSREEVKEEAKQSYSGIPQVPPTVFKVLVSVGAVVSKSSPATDLWEIFFYRGY
jgi:hypothetical protein